MIVAIHAVDDKYQGLHGIEEFKILEVVNVQEAEEIASDMSRDLIQGYSCIMDDFEEEASEIYTKGSIEWEAYVNDCIEADILYYVYEVVNNIKPFERMEREFYYDPITFIDNHCI